MRKLVSVCVVLSAIAFAIAGCTKEESNTPAVAAPPAWLVGNWGSTKFVSYWVKNDSVFLEQTAVDAFKYTFRSDGTCVIDGDKGISNHRYQVNESNGKTYLKLLPDANSMEESLQLDKLSDTSFVFNYKDMAIAEAEPIYLKMFVVKK